MRRGWVKNIKKTTDTRLPITQNDNTVELNPLLPIKRERKRKRRIQTDTQKNDFLYLIIIFQTIFLFFFFVRYPKMNWVNWISKIPFPHKKTKQNKTKKILSLPICRSIVSLVVIVHHVKVEGKWIIKAAPPLTLDSPPRRIILHVSKSQWRKCYDRRI